MSRLEIKPLTESIGPFLKGKWSATTKKQFFYPVLEQLDTRKWTQQGAHRPASGRDVFTSVQD
jgi:hypothetical protein